MRALSIIRSLVRISAVVVLSIVAIRTLLQALNMQLLCSRSGILIKTDEWMFQGKPSSILVTEEEYSSATGLQLGAQDSNTSSVILKSRVSDDPGESLVDGRHGVCAALKASSLPLSLNALWHHELENIKSSILHSPAIVGNKNPDPAMRKLIRLAAVVTDALPPRRLRRSLRPQSVSPDHHRDAIREILDIVWARRRHNDTAPPLQVLVFGGSPTVGSNCERRGTGKFDYCAWPGHLQEFVNAYLGFDAIRVVNYGMGATSSEIATMMITFGQLPPSMLPNGPDIIINAYAVNDFYRADEGSAADRIFQKLFVDFVDSVRDSLLNCNGTRPLVIYLDDLVSHCYKEQPSFQHEKTELFNSELERLTKWHQVMTVSYSDVVRDLVYANRDEAALLVDLKSGDCLHPTWAGHVGIVLTFVFQAMHSVLEFCEDEDTILATTASHTAQQPPQLAVASSSRRDTQALHSMFRPALDANVSIMSFAHVWNERQQSLGCRPAADRPSCVFSWIGLRREYKMQRQTLQDITKFNNGGWEEINEGDPTKIGYFGTGNATVVFQVTTNAAAHDVVNNIMIIYMKSYSAQWVNSRVEAKVFLGDSSNSTLVAEKVLSGYHAKRTSEYYTDQLPFEAPPAVVDHNKNRVLLQLTMTGGQTFKILGVAFCNTGTKTVVVPT